MNEEAQNPLRTKTGPFVLALDQSIQLIEGGLQILQSSDPVHFHRFSVLRLLSDGLERLLKLTLNAYRFNESGSFLTAKDPNTRSHQIADLNFQVLKEGFCFELIPALQDDLDFVQSSGLLDSMLQLLSSFAHNERYHHLDLLRSMETANSTPPEQRWDEILYLAEPGFDIPSEDAVKTIVGTVERYLRCISRSFFWNPTMREDVKSLMTYLRKPFLMISDENLGERRYPIHSLWNSPTPLG